jgi:hypothetical protein
VTPATALADGSYTATATQADDAGNSTTTAAISFRVDTVAPAVTITAPSGATNDDTPTFAGAAGNDTGDSATVTVKVYDSSNALVRTLSATRSGASWSVTPATALADGSYTATATQADDAGNSTTTAAISFRVDTVAPSSTITFPENGGSYNGATWNSGCGTPTGDICGTAADNAGGSGLQKVEISIRQGTGNYWNGTSFSSSNEFFVNATGTTSWQRAFSASDFPADGTYTVHGRATDNAGNIEAAGPTATFTMNAPPKVNPGGPYTGNEGASVLLSGTVSPDATSYSWSYAVIAAEPGASCLITNPTSLTTASIKCNEDGQYRVTLTASDGVNSTSQDTTLTLSNVAPTVTITTPAQGTTFGVNVTVSLSANLSDPGTNDTYPAGACVITWGDSTTSVGTVTAASGTGRCTGTHRYTAVGDYNITVRVTDDDAGVGTSAPRLVRIR